MASSIVDVAIIGAGAAGIAAGRKLAKTRASFVLLEARDRIGGRAHTVMERAPLDLGCGWLHSGDRNVWTTIAEAAGYEVDRTPAPWQRQSGDQQISRADQEAFGKAFAAFEERIEKHAEQGEPRPASFFLEEGNPSNRLINALFAYISGASLDQIDARDYARYEDDGINWRVRDGYGAMIAAYGAPLPVMRETVVRSIDHSGAALRIGVSRGEIEARAVIVTVPTSVLQQIAFTPALPDKIAAAAALPLGNAEKLFFALDQAEEFPVDGHLFGRADRAEMGTYHLRPLGRPLIEAFFGGALSRGLAEAGSEAMAAYAKEELADLLGSAFPSRLMTLAASSWSVDPHAMGGYSYAKPGFADQRAVLAAPVENRIFFAGEACSRNRYSTAHGAYETGYMAAEQASAALGVK
ncbi:MAG: NAD(P)/FAD-dependent oxidoreductase [Vitreimonas sp.]